MRKIKQTNGAFPYKTSNEFAALCGLATMFKKEDKIVVEDRIIASFTGSFSCGNKEFTTSLTDKEILDTIINEVNKLFKTDTTRIERTQCSGVHLVNEYFHSSSSTWAPYSNRSNLNETEVKFKLEKELKLISEYGDYFTPTGVSISPIGVKYTGTFLNTTKKTIYGSALQVELLKDNVPCKPNLNLVYDLWDDLTLFTIDDHEYDVEKKRIVEITIKRNEVFYNGMTIKDIVENHSLAYSNINEVSLHVNRLKNQISNIEEYIKNNNEKITALKELEKIEFRIEKLEFFIKEAKKYYLTT